MPLSMEIFNDEAQGLLIVFSLGEKEAFSARILLRVDC